MALVGCVVGHETAKLPPPSRPLEDAMILACEVMIYTSYCQASYPVFSNLFSLCVCVCWSGGCCRQARWDGGIARLHWRYGGRLTSLLEPRCLYLSITCMRTVCTSSTIFDNWFRQCQHRNFVCFVTIRVCCGRSEPRSRRYVRKTKTPSFAGWAQNTSACEGKKMMCLYDYIDEKHGLESAPCA